MSFKQLCDQNTIKRKSIKPNPSDQQLREQAFSQRLMLIESDIKIQRIGARTGQQFIIDESGWPKLQGEIQCSYEPCPFPSWAPSERGSERITNQTSERISERYSEPIKDEILHKKASQLLEEFNIAEKLKKEREVQQQNSERVLTDSLININQSSEKKLQQSSNIQENKYEDLRKKKSSLGAQSVAEWISCLPFCTPSKLSDLTEMVSRSRAQLSFNLGLSPIGQNQSDDRIEAIEKQKPPLRLPLLRDENKENFNYSNINLKIQLKSKSINKMVDEGVNLQKNSVSNSFFVKLLKREGQIFDEVQANVTSPNKKSESLNEDKQIQNKSDFSLLFVPTENETKKQKKNSKKGVSKKKQSKQIQRVTGSNHKIKDELNQNGESSQNQNFQCSPHFPLQSQPQDDEQQVFRSDEEHEMNFTFHEEQVPGKRNVKKGNLQKLGKIDNFKITQETELEAIIEETAAQRKITNDLKRPKQRGKILQKEQKQTDKVIEVVQNQNDMITVRKSDRQRRPNFTLQINNLFYNQGNQIKQNTRPAIRKFVLDQIKDEQTSSPSLASPSIQVKNRREKLPSVQFDSKKFFNPYLDRSVENQYQILQELLQYFNNGIEKEFRKNQNKVRFDKGKQRLDFLIFLNGKTTFGSFKCKPKYKMEVAMIKPQKDQKIKIGKRIYQEIDQINLSVQRIVRIINDSSNKMIIVLRIQKK